MMKFGGKNLFSYISRWRKSAMRRSKIAAFRADGGYAPGTRVDIARMHPGVVSQMSGVKLRFPKPVIRRNYSRIGVIAGFALIIYLIFGTPIFQLTELTVTGQHLVDEEEVRSVLFPSGFRKVNALTYGDGRAAKKLQSKLPQIADVKFEKNIFHKTLVVKVVEHETSIIWVTGGQKYLVNRNGVVYEHAPEDSPLLPVEDLKNIEVSLNQQIVAPAFIDFVSSFVANLPRRTNISIRRIVVPETTFEIEMETDEGWKIILDTTASYEEQLNNLVRVLRELQGEEGIEEYVDLRIGKKVFYK